MHEQHGRDRKAATWSNAGPAINTSLIHCCTRPTSPYSMIRQAVPSIALRARGKSWGCALRGVADRLLCVARAAVMSGSERCTFDNASAGAI
jgi:hypothetical protein